MVSYLHTFLLGRSYGRISSITIGILCAVSVLPYPLICSDVATEESPEADNLVKKFQDLQENLQQATNPAEESRRFIQSFINEINIRHGLNLTMHDACRLVYDNLHILQITEENKRLLLDVIAFLEFAPLEPSQKPEHRERTAGFNHPYLMKGKCQDRGFFKKKKSKKKQEETHRFTRLTPLEKAAAEAEYPGSVYAGSMEIFGGAILATLGMIFTPAYGAGTALIVDGVRRIYNGMEEVSNQRQPTCNQ